MPGNTYGYRSDDGRAIPLTDRRLVIVANRLRRVIGKRHDGGEHDDGVLSFNRMRLPVANGFMFVSRTC